MEQRPIDVIEEALEAANVYIVAVGSEGDDDNLHMILRTKGSTFDVCVVIASIIRRMTESLATKGHTEEDLQAVIVAIILQALRDGENLEVRNIDDP